MVRWDSEGNKPRVSGEDGKDAMATSRIQAAAIGIGHLATRREVVQKPWKANTIYTYCRSLKQITTMKPKTSQNHCSEFWWFQGLPNLQISEIMETHRYL